MNPAAHATTAPEDRISFGHKVAYGAGAFVNNLLAAASGGMMIVLNLGLGMNPALVGLLAIIGPASSLKPHGSVEIATKPATSPALAPAPASPRAMARPSPRPPPVTTAMRPS